jgi:hypothetical protein
MKLGESKRKGAGWWEGEMGIGAMITGGSIREKEVKKKGRVRLW